MTIFLNILFHANIIFELNRNRLLEYSEIDAKKTLGFYFST